MTFDLAAHSYDQDFSTQALAHWLRQRVWARLDGMFLAGMRVLEIGCGTGEDARYLAQKGVEVIATDASPKMLEVTQVKAGYLPIRTQILDLNQPQTWQVEGPIDGVFSNFGALNCTSNWAALAAWLAQTLPPNAPMGLALMGRFCLWESLWHGLHGDFRTASRRWSGQSEAILADGSRLPVFYPAPQAFIRLMQPFQLRDFRALGVFIPPSDVFPVIQARPRLQAILTRLEGNLASVEPWRRWGDHFWVEFSSPNQYNGKI